MTSSLYSVGLDVGTTTTQMVLSKLEVENRATGFAVPEMVIGQRHILYRSPVIFTPLLAHRLVDGDKLQQWILQQYRQAGIGPEQVDTGAVIITGETSRKENAAQILQSLSTFAGDFVVATAGPDLESVLAAKGAGAVEYSQTVPQKVLHIDIGGGTSNMALIHQGQILQTGCLNVGGRLVKLDGEGVVTYLSPVLAPVTDLRPGDRPTTAQLEDICRCMVQALEMAVGRRPATGLLQHFWTEETRGSWQIPTGAVILSFSGGVADCIDQHRSPTQFGDLGGLLGQTIRQSLLCSGAYMLGQETIGATVIGAGCHSTQLSGSTVFCRNVALPKKNLPVVSIPPGEQNDPARIANRLSFCDASEAVLALEGVAAPDYAQVRQLAHTLVQAVGQRPLYVCLQQDMAKALGQAISLLLPPDAPCLCLDRLQFAPESYLDVGQPVGPCYPVVIKTLVLSRQIPFDNKGENTQ